MFCDLPFNTWIPENHDMEVLINWLTNYSIDHLLNRIARITFSRLNWSYATNNELFIQKEIHQKLAIALFTALNGHNVMKNPKNIPNSNSKEFGCHSLLSLAKSENTTDFCKWVWNELIVLKLHSLELNAHNWDHIFASDNCLNDSDILMLDFDTNLLPVCKALEEQNPFAIYLALIMTDFGQRFVIYCIYCAYSLQLTTNIEFEFEF